MQLVISQLLNYISSENAIRKLAKMKLEGSQK